MTSEQAADMTYHCTIKISYILYHDVGGKMVEHLKRQSCKDMRLSAIIISPTRAQDSEKEPARRRDRKIRVGMPTENHPRLSQYLCAGCTCLRTCITGSAQNLRGGSRGLPGPAGSAKAKHHPDQGRCPAGATDCLPFGDVSTKTQDI